MVLIFSEIRDVTTDEVVGWLRSWGIPCVRINRENSVVSVDITLDDDGEDYSLRFADGQTLTISEVTVCWHSRGQLRFHFEDEGLSGASPVLNEEWRAIEALVFSKLDGIPHLGADRPGERRTKPAQLRIAKSVGMLIPRTIITTNREALGAFAKKHGKVVTKTIQAPPVLSDGDDSWWAPGTRIVHPDEIDALPGVFFPSLAQAFVDKTCELRVAYLAGQCYPMAIMASEDEATPVDCRTHGGPLRYVPYVLPGAIENKIRAFMEAASLDIGALDIIVTPGDQFVFLEVNPVGQIDWLSKACNYHLERTIARHLCALGGFERAQ